MYVARTQISSSGALPFARSVDRRHHIEERDRDDGDPRMVEVRHGLGDRRPRGEAGVIVEVDDDVAAGETRYEVAGERGAERAARGDER